MSGADAIFYIVIFERLVMHREHFHVWVSPSNLTKISLVLVMCVTGHHGMCLDVWQRGTGRSQSTGGWLASAKPQTICTTVPGVTWPIFQFGMACAVTIIFLFRNRWDENTQKKRNNPKNLKTTEFKFQCAPSFIGPYDTDCIITELLNYNGSFSSWNRNPHPAKPKACTFKGQRNCMFIFAPGK